MATIIIGVGDMAVSKKPGDTIKTFALGSCVGVMISDPDNGAVGMLHCVLPESKTNRQKAEQQPAYFADSGIAALVKALEGLGSKRSRRWVVKLAGGAKVLKQNDSEAMAIGKRNILAVRKNLWKVGLGAVAEDVGKDYSRTVSISVGNPKVLVENAKIGNTTL